jgi:hypothetical protein
VSETQHKHLRNDVKFNAFAEEQVDVAEDEIHYEHKRYYRHREEERPEVVAKDISLEDHRRTLCLRRESSQDF